jgi:hypothetical protein
MSQLQLLVTSVDDDEPTARVSTFDTAMTGREFARGPFGHTYMPATNTMVASYACEGWEDVRGQLKDEGHLHQFQPWIDGLLVGVSLSPDTERPASPETEDGDGRDHLPARSD